MPIKKPYKEAPDVKGGGGSRTDRIYYTDYKEEMKPAMRWPSKTVSIDVYRTDPKTQKLESLAHKYDIGFGNQLDENSARLPIDPGMLHAIHDANKISSLGISPKEMVSLIAQEGRTDFGANDLNVEHFAHNKQAVALYDKLKAMGYDEMQAGLPALMLEKKRVADKLDVPWQAAWQGMGTTETGRTHKDYMKELSLNAANVSANKDALAAFTREMSEPAKARTLNDVNFSKYLARQKMVQEERDKMKAQGASDQETQRAFPDAPIPFPDAPNAGLYEMQQKYAKGGSVKKKFKTGGDVSYDKKKVDALVAEIKLPPIPTLNDTKKPDHPHKETLSDKLDQLSAGLGEGFSNQLMGTAQLIEHPIESGKTIVKGVKAVIKDPSIIKDVAQDIAERATGSTQGFGEVIGENVNPVGLVRRLAGVGNPALKIIKEKGGNWLKGNMTSVNLQTVSPENYAAHLTSAGQSDELNNWINTKLVKYMKNDMGTAEDPVRKLFDQGVRHAEVRNQFLPHTTMRARTDAGMPPKGLAENPMGEAWEGAVDMTVLPRSSFRYMPSTVGSSQLGGSGYPKILENNPWLAKVPPETPVHALSDQLYATDDRLGFQHLVDELHNATHPAGDLPEHLRLDAKKLDKVTVPQAVQLVDKINKWRKENMAEANALVANNPATILHKDYPEEGFRWVQLRTPLDPKVRLQNPNALRDALKYEGDVMGHCVGGYCPAVEKGESQIFSLRDKKGEPHVTIEVAPQDFTPQNYYHSGQMSDELMNRLDSEYRYGGRGGPTWNDKIEESQEYQDYIQSLPPTIVQIKGKANEAPVEKYIPYVQDFVKSRDWHSVDDLENARLHTLDRDPYDDLGMSLMQLRARMDEASHAPTQKYYTEDELNDLFGKYKINTEGYAEGGLVAPTASMEYDPERVQSIADQLRQEMYNA